MSEGEKRMKYRVGSLVPNIDPSVYLADGSKVIGEVTIGKDSSVWFNTVIRGDEGPIHIGERVNIQDGSMIHQYEGYPTIIEDEVTIGHMAMIHGGIIRKGALIGMSATILDEAEIGEGAFVAAGSLVPPKMKVPAGAMVMGVPAKIIRDISDHDRFIMERTIRKYVKRGQQYADSCEAITEDLTSL